MVNIVDRLFDDVLGQIGEEGLDRAPEWDEPPLSEETDDFLDFPILGGELYPLSDELLGERAIDTLLGGRFPPVDLQPDDRDLIEGGIRARGLEALAFYKSRRFIKWHPFPGKWGIFYLKDGLLYVAEEIAATYPGYHDPRRIAHQFLRAHEHFHFRCDLQTLMFEATLNRNIYLPLRRALRGRRTWFVEEAMANKAAYDWAKKPHIGIHEFAFDFMSLQPNAYARFTESRLRLYGEWLANVLDLKPPGSPPRSDIPQWVDSTPKDFLRSSLCPEYVVYLTRLSDWINPAYVPPPVRLIKETDFVRSRIAGIYKNIEDKWNRTKAKLLAERTLRGLNFKPWRKDGENAYSVRVDDNFRAHLRHEGNGIWLTYTIGPHTELGHG